MTTPSAPPWLARAHRELGRHEIVGVDADPAILAYRDAARCGWVTGSEESVPWCALFVNAMLEREGFRGSRSPAARSFLRDPGFVALAAPAAGAIAVIERVPAHASFGHVGFVVGADARWLTLLGGNQGDAVTVSRYARSRLVGFRWPAAAARPRRPGDFVAAETADEGRKVA